MKTRFVAAVLAGLVLLPVAQAQEEARRQTVTVSASIIDVDDRRAAPAIYRNLRADFVQVEVTVQSGSRDAAVRRKELETSYDRLLETVADTDGFELSGGDIGFSTAPIESVLFADVISNYGTQGSFSLILTVDTRPDESFDKLMERAEAFLETIKPAGRAEAFLGSEQYIGARNMGTHRKALLDDIVAEVNALRSQLGAGSVTLSGLEGRVITQPSGPLELEIFIPYTLTAEWGAAD